MSNQPIWRTVYATDSEKLSVDETGVYAPELTIGVSLDRAESRFAVYRFSIDRCTYVNGILSANRFHPELAEWFAHDLARVASYAGMTESEMIETLCADDPAIRAQPYGSIASYHGYENFDAYPLTVTEREFAEILT